jgi:hypothetical protein
MGKTVDKRSHGIHKRGSKEGMKIEFGDVTRKDERWKAVIRVYGLSLNLSAVKLLG